MKLKKEFNDSSGKTIPVFSPNPKCVSKSPRPKTAMREPRPRRYSEDFCQQNMGGDYESDLDSDIDSESFDSDQIVPDFTMEQFETDFQYVKIRVSTDAENTKHIVILDK